MRSDHIPVMKMLPNRVRRNYLGGWYIDTLREDPHPADGDIPEEWLASTVEAKNPGLPPIPNEGLSTFLNDGRPQLLRDVLAEDPAYYLGDPRSRGLDFLAKWLDSSIRLHTQVHPTRAFANTYLGCDHGKFEAYYVLATRPSVRQPYIRLGFQQPGITQKRWTRIVKEQDIEAMDACFERVPVKTGDVIYIPGGVPHAIGEGIFLLEMLEPSDLVVRCEFNRNGIVVPPPARFMGLDPDFCMRMFVYQSLSVDEVRKRFFLTPKVLKDEGTYRDELLIGADVSPCFVAHRLTFTNKQSTWEKDGRYAVLACTKGSGELGVGPVHYSVRTLDAFFVPAGTSHLNISPGSDGLELCMLQPIEDDAQS